MLHQACECNTSTHAEKNKQWAYPNEKQMIPKSIYHQGMGKSKPMLVQPQNGQLSRGQ